MRLTATVHRATDVVFVSVLCLMVSTPAWGSYAQFRFSNDVVLVVIAVTAVILSPVAITAVLLLARWLGWRPGRFGRGVLGVCGVIQLLYALLLAGYVLNAVNGYQIMSAPFKFLIFAVLPIVGLAILGILGLYKSSDA